MTGLYTQDFFSDICEEIRLFIDTRKIDRLPDCEPFQEGYSVLHRSYISGSDISSEARLYCNGDIISDSVYSCNAGNNELERKRNAKRAAKISVYRALQKHFGISMPWGALTGIRPTKLLRDSEALLGEEARALFLNDFGVSLQKMSLQKA